MIRPLYKAVEPFMEVKHGYGFQGVMMYDDKEDKVQCHICGKWFENVGQHSWRTHKVLADDYKMDFGMTLRTPLCSKGMSSKRSKSTLRAIARGDIIPADASDQSRTSKTPRRKYRHNGGQTMFHKNQYGLCDLQIRARYEVVKRQVGHEPNTADIMRYDKKLFGCGIVPRFGNLNNFRKHIGVRTQTWGEFAKVPTINLIAQLRSMSKMRGRHPRPTDFGDRRPKGFNEFKNFYRTFGSWVQALRTAGLK